MSWLGQFHGVMSPATPINSRRSVLPPRRNLEFVFLESSDSLPECRETRGGMGGQARRSAHLLSKGGHDLAFPRAIGLHHAVQELNSLLLARPGEGWKGLARGPHRPIDVCRTAEGYSRIDLLRRGTDEFEGSALDRVDPGSADEILPVMTQLSLPD